MKDERDISFRDYVDVRFADQEQAVQAALAAAEKAVVKAELAADKRFESVNEFRGQLTDQANTFISRLEYNANQKAIEQKIETLQRLVFMGTGVLLTLEVVLRFLTK